MAVAELSDPQEKVDANMALTWAQIECGDQVGARASLDHAAEAASALKAEPRCYARVRIARRGERPVTGREASPCWLRHAVEADTLGEDRPWPLKSIAVAQSELGDRDAARATIRRSIWRSSAPRTGSGRRWTTQLERPRRSSARGRRRRRGVPDLCPESPSRGR